LREPEGEEDGGTVWKCRDQYALEDVICDGVKGGWWEYVRLRCECEIGRAVAQAEEIARPSSAAARIHALHVLLSQAVLRPRHRKARLDTRTVQ